MYANNYWGVPCTLMEMMMLPLHACTGNTSRRYHATGVVTLRQSSEDCNDNLSNPTQRTWPLHTSAVQLLCLMCTSPSPHDGASKLQHLVFNISSCEESRINSRWIISHRDRNISALKDTSQHSRLWCVYFLLENRHSRSCNNNKRQIHVKCCVAPYHK